MEYEKPRQLLNYKEYSNIVPLSKLSCTLLSKIGLYTSSKFPFDYSTLSFSDAISYFQSNRSLNSSSIYDASEYLSASFERLDKVLNNSSQSVLFVWISQPHDVLEYSACAEFMNLIRKRYSTLQFTFITLLYKQTFSDESPNFFSYTYNLSDNLNIPLQLLKHVLVTESNGAKVTLVTPCSRPEYLQLVKKYMRFDLIKMWFIIYDTSKDKKYPRQFLDHPQIIELESSKACPGGNPPRNKGIELIEDGFVYFLDDDNIMHPKFWEILPFFEEDSIYTWNQVTKEKKSGQICKRTGNRIRCGRIDLAQYIVPRKLMGDIRFIEGARASDGYFICDLHKKHREVFKHIDKEYCFYNFIPDFAIPQNLKK